MPDKHCRKGSGIRNTLLACLVGWGLAVPTPTRAEVVHVPDFVASVDILEQEAGMCAQDANACDPNRVPGPQQVSPLYGKQITVRWDWLQETFRAAQSAKDQDRAHLMAQTRNHLQILLADLQTPGSATEATTFAQARLAAKAALARNEFRTAQENPSWFDRLMARLQNVVLQAFWGLGRLGAKTPWLGTVIMWGCFALAAAGVMWLVQRSLQRQALRIALNQGPRLDSRTTRSSTDWAAMSEKFAEMENWREAVHCTYWATIAHLENRRAWQPDTTRTPREYLRLLRSGSKARKDLEEITSLFERTWYGKIQANASTFEDAWARYSAFQQARAELTGDVGRGASVAGAA